MTYAIHAAFFLLCIAVLSDALPVDVVSQRTLKFGCALAAAVIYLIALVVVL